MVVKLTCFMFLGENQGGLFRGVNGYFGVGRGKDIMKFSQMCGIYLFHRCR